MVQRLIVPVDGSNESWRAVDVAIVLARRCVAPVDVVEVVFGSAEREEAETYVADAVEALQVDDVEIVPHVEVATDTVVDTLAALIERRPDATVVMSSHGRGRSAALLGSVTDDLLQREFGPIVVVGPNVKQARLDGPLVACVDGSHLSEEALPLAAAWGIELGSTPWVVEVNEPTQVSNEHLLESSYPARLARHLSTMSGHPTEFEVLHSQHPHDEIADFADRMGATLIVATTHGRTGLSRLTVGSTAAGIVRVARCPVLLVRPPRVQDGSSAADGNRGTTSV